MPKELNNLTTEEQQMLLDAIPYITILVAGADGEIDPKEIESSGKIAKIRAFSYEEDLRPFYTKVGNNFEDRFFTLLDELPGDVEERKQAISNKLSGLNAILPKLDHFYARLYYQSLRSFADHVANASGGVMGWLSVGFEEYKVVDLPMIEPIE